MTELVNVACPKRHLSELDAVETFGEQIQQHSSDFRSAEVEAVHSGDCWNCGDLKHLGHLESSVSVLFQLWDAKHDEATVSSLRAPKKLQGSFSWRRGPQH